MLLNCSHIRFFFFFVNSEYLYSRCVQIYKWQAAPCIFNCIGMSLRIRRHSEIFTLALLSVVLKLGCLDARWRRNGHSWLQMSPRQHRISWSRAFECGSNWYIHVVSESFLSSSLEVIWVHTLSRQDPLEYRLSTCGQSLDLLLLSCADIWVKFLHSAWLNR